MSASVLENQIRENYSDKNVLLVDFFDTCVSRDVHPEYIKYLWAGKIRELLGLRISSDEVYQIRNAIEAELCEQNRSAGLDQDFYFPSLSKAFYQHILEFYRDISKLIAEKEFVQASSLIELELELKFQHLLEDVIGRLRKEKDSGKVLILVSDFYLAKEEFEAILKHHQIEDLFSEIFVSSEYSLTKRTGRLFDLLIKECSLNTSKTEMIGDNLHSDYEVPKSKGIRAIHLDHSSKKAHDDELFLKAISLDLTRTSLWKETKETLVEGPIFNNIALTLYSFISRLYNRLREDGVRDVFFLSREGEFLKKIFDLYQEKLSPKSFINTHYFLASRRSTFLPSLNAIDKENFEILFRQYVQISGREFLLSLNLDEDWLRIFQNNFTEDLDTREEHFPSSTTFQRIINEPTFRSEYERKRLEQKRHFLEYLDSFNVDLTNESFSIVDVGWKGSMQDNFRRIIPENTLIHGYYLGLYTNPNISSTNIKEGIIFSPAPSPQYGSWIYSNTLSVYEILLGASHGSATQYLKDTKGKLSVSLSSHEYETRLYQEKILPLLNAYYKTFSKLCDIFSGTHFNIENFDRMCAEFHASMILMPSKEELNFIERVSHFENFGVFEFTEFKSERIALSIKAKNAYLFFKNPHELLKDSMWPAITFKKLGLSFLQRFYGWYQFKLAFDNGDSKSFKYVRKFWRI